MEEVWKDVVGYEGIYLISNFGEIKDKTGVLQYKNWNGYNTVFLYKNKKRKSLLAHQLVASAFIKNPYNRKEVNHKNGIKNDNRVENLEWCTRSDNIIHSVHCLKKINKDFW